MTARIIAILLTLGIAVPAARSADWVFEGNAAFSAAQLVQALARYDVVLAPESDITTADDAAYFLREFYFRQGFPDADVTYEFHPDRTIFRIDEGGRMWIGKLRFEGGGELGRQRLEGIFAAAVRQATRAPFGRLRFVEAAVEDAAGRIRQAFAAEGFRAASVEAVSQLSADFRTADVTILIEAGQQFRISAVRLEGASPEQSAALENALREFIGRPSRPQYAALARSRTVDFLRSRGHFFAAAEASLEEESQAGCVALVVAAQPGPILQIGKVSAQGGPRTADRTILRRMGIRPGQTFDAGALDAAERRLWFSGAFADVNVTTSPGPGDRLDVAVKVTESEARSLSATLGYSQWFLGFANASFVDRNFLGSLNRLNLSAFISQRSFGGEATYADPWLFGSDLTGSASAFVTSAELPAYEATQLGVRLGLSQRENDRLGTGWGLDYEWKAVRSARFFGGEEATFEDYQLGRLTFRQQLDRRNDPATPMSGYNLRYDAGLSAPPLLGSLTFFKATAQATWYVPLQKISRERPFVPFLTLNHRAGLILPFGGTDSIPLPERLFLGGPDSVRSFQFDGMAPRDRNGIPTGGLAFVQANVELQWPVGRGFFLAVFTDVGNLAPEIQDMDPAQTRIAPGAGIRFYTPLGALRIDYAANAVREDGDPLGAWQFGLGVTF